MNEAAAVEQAVGKREDRLSRFLPISDYAMIGDCNGSALVARDGSIDWCCLGRFDAEPIFSRILDRHKGGCFDLWPEGIRRVERAYVDATNILTSRIEARDGVVILRDFMPLSGHDTRSYGLVRMIEVESGKVAMNALFQPRRGFSGEPRRMRAGAFGSISLDGLDLRSDLDWTLADGEATARWTQAAGETRVLALSAEPVVGELVEHGRRLLDETVRFWRGWCATQHYDGPYRKQVARSALVLKLMTYAPTGAMVAAPTTSLPEWIGGIRNWDYRYCWPRDASFAFYALKKLGHVREAERFFAFFRKVFDGKGPPLPPLYAIDGESDPTEREIEAYEGYRGSRPVRAGNEAAEQHQTDVYGQLLDLMYLYDRLDGPLTDDMRQMGEMLAEFVAAHWRDPDAGLWEPRLSERRHVHSAIMCWTALDRAIRLFGERPDWVEAREAVLADIREKGVDSDGGYLTQVFGCPDADAAVLIAHVVGIPLDEAVLNRTVDAVIEQLGHGPLVYRYRNDDGLPGHEGTFLVCAFWLVDALLVLGRYEEARQRFEALLEFGNDVGLYPEEMGEDGTFLGNFPQAFTHLGLVQSALMLELYEEGGVEAVRGTYADRALRARS